jgi:hypothetical protein
VVPGLRDFSPLISINFTGRVKWRGWEKAFKERQRINGIAIFTAVLINKAIHHIG